MNPLRDYLIRFAEPGSHDFHILCNKPECKHEQEFTLIQMDMMPPITGEIVDLPKQFEPNGTNHLGGSYFFDNGFLIYVAMPPQADPTMRCRFTRSSWKPERPPGCFRRISRFTQSGHRRMCLSATGTSTFPAPGKRRKARLCRRQPGNRAHRAGI